MASSRKILISDIDNVILKLPGGTLSRPYINWVKQQPYPYIEIIPCSARSMGTSFYQTEGYKSGEWGHEVFTSVVASSFSRETELPVNEVSLRRDKRVGMGKSFLQIKRFEETFLSSEVKIDKDYPVAPQKTEQDEDHFPVGNKNAQIRQILEWLLRKYGPGISVDFVDDNAEIFSFAAYLSLPPGVANFNVYQYSAAKDSTISLVRKVKAETIPAIDLQVQRIISSKKSTRNREQTTREIQNFLETSYLNVPDSLLTLGISNGFSLFFDEDQFISELINSTRNPIEEYKVGETSIPSTKYTSDTIHPASSSFLKMFTVTEKFKEEKIDEVILGSTIHPAYR